MACTYRIEYLGAEALLSFDYDEEAVDAIKTLPFWGRKWHPDLRAWRIHPHLEDRARELLEDLGFVNAEERKTARPPRREQQKPVSPWAMLWLREGAPKEVVHAAYRALALLHHPDVGGNTEQMQEINLAYETLCKSLNAR